MNLSLILSFLAELKKNNAREWFHANKPIYQQARHEFQKLVNGAVLIINEFDSSIGAPDAKDCMFRINRDIRFSKDKSPYKTNFGAFISRGGRKSEWAGYYIHLEPGNSFLGGGAYMPAAFNLKSIRMDIYEEYDEFLSIVQSKPFKSHFPEFYDDRLKTVPRGFPKDFRGIHWLRYKSYAAMHSVEDRVVKADDFSKTIASTFKALYPLNRFLNNAMEQAMEND